MTRDEYIQQFNQLTQQSRADGRFEPQPHEMLAVLDEDTNSHGGWCFVYAMHTGWAARILMEQKTKKHVDFSSQVYFAATASAITEMFEIYDYRRVHLPLPGLYSGIEDLTKLSFADESFQSVSCMHVIEHIGLGRYGDPIDASGDLKAAKELNRVLAPGGQMIIVLPVNKTSRVVFNVHRHYTHEQVLSMFPELVLQEFTLIDGSKITRNANPDNIRNVRANEYEDAGCYHFVKL